MKKCVFLLMLIAVCNIAFAKQDPQFCTYINGAWTTWTEWEKWSGDSEFSSGSRGHDTYDTRSSSLNKIKQTWIFGTASSFSVVGYQQPQNFAFKVNIQNFRKPSAKEIGKEGIWLEFNGTIEFYITDECQDLNAIMQRYQKNGYCDLWGYTRYLNRKPKKAVSLPAKIQVYFMRYKYEKGYTPLMGIPVNGHCNMITTYNIWVQNYGIGISMGTGDRCEFGIFYK